VRLAGADFVRVAVSPEDAGTRSNRSLYSIVPRSELSWLVFTLVRTVPSHIDKPDRVPIGSG
jgi:hypothetical protein